MNKQFKQEYRMSSSGDKWGDSMLAHFAIADCLYRHECEIPDEWRYSPGMSAGELDTDDYIGETIELMLNDKDITLDELTHIGNVLHRYEDILRMKGFDY